MSDDYDYSDDEDEYYDEDDEGLMDTQEDGKPSFLICSS
jgi:hypothetical protein